MTDLPELITNVYRACGKPIETPVVYPNGDICFAYGYSKMRGYIGLDAFVRDIVPTLNERGWSYSIGNDPSGRRHLALIWKRNADALFEVSKGSPVEACFRAAWEALRPSASPSDQTHHPSA